jgi:hypothetical protein
MHFVSYHSCGAVDEPWMPSCNRHREITVRLPGTTSLSEMRFSCPSCDFVSWGFIPRKCSCGTDYMKVTVHRAAVVYTPQIAVVVNPPDPAAAARIRAAGGGARAVEWILQGMRAADPTTGAQTVAGLVETLIRSGLSPETARELAKQAAARGEVAEGGDLPELRWTPEVRDTAEEQALSLASAVAGGRVRVEDMISATTPPLRTLYDVAYPAALRSTSIEAVELLPSFPVATLAYGYTRGNVKPGESRLVPFRERGHLRAYGAINRTEALLFRLDPLAVHTWLVERGDLAAARVRDGRAARISILENVLVPSAGEESPQRAGGTLLTLVHSFAHRLVRRLSAFAGIDRDGLGEYLLPYHLAFVVYAASRGEFVLGGLQAVFETSLDRVLDDFVNGEARCPLDPGCRSGGGACMACLHLGEPSCRYFNRFLDRSALFGPTGFIR